MMGRSHAVSGWCVGLLTAPVAGLTTIPALVIYSLCVAGFALLPDLDCENARASRVLGFVTQAVSWWLRRASAFTYRLTRTSRDRGAGVHRHLSHTLLFAAALGGLTAVGASAIGKWFVLGVVVFGVILAEDAMGDWVAPVAAAMGVALVVTSEPLAALADIGGWIGVAVFVGCVTHCVGDAATLSGCPILAPIRIKGEAWFEIGPPRSLRFRTDGDFEHLWVFPALTVLGVLLFPGVWSTAGDVLWAISQAGSKG